MRMNEYQREVVTELLSEIKHRSPFYAEKFKDIDLTNIRTQEDFETLPFTDKGDLREAYPLGLAAVPEKDIFRIHSDRQSRVNNDFRITRHQIGRAARPENADIASDI